ncbi:YraN family protein [uncultured Enterovirga sp.]|uniref:YraN family protein n=1 Tax=uncultured Enterovirga sp. TaxID=2026352 RepID=UPI0035CB83EE
MRTAAGRRRFTLLRGRGAERLALLWLMAKGYRPLARNYAEAGGEIDLVMRRGRTVAFVEVKIRATMAGALESVDEGKRRRIRRAARAWITRHPSVASLTFRADAVFLAPGEWPRHMPDAFGLD